MLEHCSDDLNHVAVMRTCEALGIYRVWLIEATGDDEKQTAPARNAGPRAVQRLQERANERGFAFDRLLGGKRAQNYLTHLDVRRFTSVAECVAALRDDGRTLWVTDLSQEALPLPLHREEVSRMLPKRVAVVLGSEGAGVSAAMIAAADERIFLPMFGFTESFNLSVSAALVLQKLLEACPESRGDLPVAETAQIRRAWYAQLAKTEDQRLQFERLAERGGAEPLRDTRRPQCHRDEHRNYSRRESHAAGSRPREINGNALSDSRSGPPAPGRAESGAALGLNEPCCLYRWKRGIFTVNAQRENTTHPRGVLVISLGGGYIVT